MTVARVFDVVFKKRPNRGIRSHIWSTRCVREDPAVNQPNWSLDGPTTLCCCFMNYQGNESLGNQFLCSFVRYFEIAK